MNLEEEAQILYDYIARQVYACNGRIRKSGGYLSEEAAIYWTKLNRVQIRRARQSLIVNGRLTLLPKHAWYGDDVEWYQILDIPMKESGLE